MARPKEFIPEDALEKAMQTFWAKGYYDTSIRDLVTSTGVGPYGLYSTFKDKDGLFLAALDRYRDTVTRTILNELKQADGGAAAIRRAFDRALKIMRGSKGPVGCLMCITAMERAPHDRKAANKVARHMALLSKEFLGAVERAQQADEIPRRKDPRVLADYLTATLYSVGMLLRAGQSAAYVKRYVRTALEGAI